ncbi:MAG: endonuclease [Burkholderia sp.]|nr:endonuclease [Burkholderia sp.]
MRITHRLFAVLLTGISLSVASGAIAAKAASFDRCPRFFVNGDPPRIPNEPFWMPRALCYDAFATLHSGTTKTPLFVAERLNRTELEATRDGKRAERFFADKRLPRVERAQLVDYINSGFSEGRLAQPANVPTKRAVAQSFSLANSVPQAPRGGQKAWAEIEMTTREYVMRAAGDVYTISGPVFGSDAPTIGPGKVRVPKYLYKLVYDPSSGEAWAYWLENADEASVDRPISYDELVARTGIQFLPGVTIKR